MEELSKKKKEKHDHKLTKLLQVSIFAILMLAPFFAVGMKCIYTLNKNAKESYYGETINNKEQHNGYKDLETYYTIHPIDFNTYTSPIIYDVNNFTYEGNVSTNIADNYTKINQLYFYITNDRSICRVGFNDETPAYYWYYSSNNTDVYFHFYLTSKPQNSEFSNYTIYYTYNKYSYLDNSFYYAIDQLKEESIFNWSKNTGIYTTIKAMTDGLGINEVVPMLLAYWSMLTAVYIVFDIIIFCFVHITHFLND